MSHLITDLTSKIFITLLGIMMLMAVYFATYSYFQNVNSAKSHLQDKLKGISQTLAYQFDGDELASKLLSENQTDSTLSGLNKADYRNVQKQLFKARVANSLPANIYLVIKDSTTGKLHEVATSALVPGTNAFDAEISRHFLQTQNFSQVFAHKRMNAEWLTAAASIRNRNGQIVAMVVIDYPFQTVVSKARSTFIWHLSGAMLFMFALGFAARGTIKRILHHEAISKKKLEEYVRMIDGKNEELKKLHLALSKSDNLILLTDIDGNIEWLNQSTKRKNNYTAQELRSFKNRNVCDVSHYPEIEKMIEQVVRTQTKASYEAKNSSPNGREFWAKTTVTPILDKDGKCRHLLFIDSDITDIKRAQQEIEKLAMLPMEHNSPVLRVDKKGRVLFHNKGAACLLSEWGALQTLAIEKSKVTAIITKCFETRENQELTIEVGQRIFQVRFSPIAEQGYLNIFGDDITERHRSEQEIRSKSNELEQFNINLTDSINYARRIQEAIIPSEDHIRSFFLDSFVLNKPRDIVSGDFHWIHEVSPKSEYIVASIDCTGHGVPGAMMSLIAHNLLTDIVEHQKNHNPAYILEKLNLEIIRSLRQKSNNASDGLDIALCRINTRKLEITFAGAYRPIYWMNGKLNELKGDKQPIGGIAQDTRRKFTNHTFNVSKGDCIYLFSDGFVDQFGGPNGKKFMSKRFREMIEKNHQFSMQAQGYLYSEIFDSWKGNEDQVDDVSLIGIRF